MDYCVCRDRSCCWCLRKLPRLEISGGCWPSPCLALPESCSALVSPWLFSLPKVRSTKHPALPSKKTMPEPIPQWDYRPRKPIRGRAVLDSPSTETSDGLSSDPFGINDNVWLNDDSDEGATPTFLNDPPHAEEPMPESLSQTTHSVGAAPTVDAEASEVRPKSNRQSTRRR